MYDVCLPIEFATSNLLPDVRHIALEVFASSQIRWHEQIDDGPSNHLLDSQVQCVNALAPGILDSGFVANAFADVLSIAEVLEVEPGRYLTFEYIGADDHLSEGRGQPRTRGSLTTSADAAIRYRTPKNTIEVALIEWKFTEDYRGRELTPSRRPRTEIYRSLWEDDTSGLRRDVVPYEDLFVEPFYQLLRQQLLAARMEDHHELDADVVRVVHVCPVENEGVHGSLNRTTHQDAGDDALTIWADICTKPGRFISIDSERFCSQHVRGSEYAHRYSVPAQSS
jgi:hypothetical protein